jgi:hypothetical protein
MKQLALNGFIEDEFGQLTAPNCNLNFYQVLGDWEITVALPNGQMISFNVPLGQIHFAPHPDENRHAVKSGAPIIN